jgi:hypothetical protein
VEPAADLILLLLDRVDKLEARIIELVLSPIINIVFYRQGAKVAKNIIIDFTEHSWRS